MVAAVTCGQARDREAIAPQRPYTPRMKIQSLQSDPGGRDRIRQARTRRTSPICRSWRRSSRIPGTTFTFPGDRGPARPAPPGSEGPAPAALPKERCGPAHRRQHDLVDPEGRLEGSDEKHSAVRDVPSLELGDLRVVGRPAASAPSGLGSPARIPSRAGGGSRDAHFRGARSCSSSLCRALMIAAFTSSGCFLPVSRSRTCSIGSQTTIAGTCVMLHLFAASPSFS